MRSSLWLRTHGCRFPQLRLIDLRAPERQIGHLSRATSTRQIPKPCGRQKKRAAQVGWLPRRADQGTATQSADRQSCRKMHTYVQLVTAPTADLPCMTVMVHFDKCRYMFGQVGEGTQRLMSQRKLGLSKVQHVFLTGSMRWTDVGGLLGLLLSATDVKLSALREGDASRYRKGLAAVERPDVSLDVHGGQNLVHLMATARRFIYRDGVPLRLHERNSDPWSDDGSKSVPDWQDENIRVWKVSIPLGARKGGRSRGGRSPDCVQIPSSRSKRKSNVDRPGRKEEEAEVSEEDSGEDSGGGRRAKKARSQARSQASHERATARFPAEELEAERESREGVCAGSGQVREATVHDIFSAMAKAQVLTEVNLHDVNWPAAVFVQGDDGKLKAYDGPLPATSGRSCPDVRVLEKREYYASSLKQMPRTHPAQVSTNYFVKTHDRRGKFRREEAERLGVARKDFKLLTKGETVAGKDGIAVTPSMVLEASIEGRGFGIFYLPDLESIEPCWERSEWANEEIMGGIEAIYWRISPPVWTAPRFGDLLARFPKIRHVLFSESLCPNELSFTSAAEQMVRFNSIDPCRFPLPVSSSESTALPDFLDGPNVDIARPGAILRLAPVVSFQHDPTASRPEMEEVLKEVLDNTQVGALKAAALKKISDPTFRADVAAAEEGLPSRDTEIVTLGTGSMLPSKYRNVSSTLIRVPGHGSYLFDCGEGTLGQIRRRFGEKGAEDVIRDMRAIYISHLHADHHLGTLSVIRAWKDLVLSPDGHGGGKMALIAHENYIAWIREVGEMDDFGFHCLELIRIRGRYIPGRKADIFWNRTVSGKLEREQYETRFGFSAIDACFVDHTNGATAVALTFPTGLKVAYSGDCRPSDAFASMARGAHLLIHECTFQNELGDEAVAKQHSTMAEALEVAAKMNARRVILTHFSQRYPKLPIFAAGPERDPTVDRAVLYAFDLMTVRLGDFREAEAFLPAICKLYEADEVGESKSSVPTQE